MYKMKPTGTIFTNKTFQKVSMAILSPNTEIGNPLNVKCFSLVDIMLTSANFWYESEGVLSPTTAKLCSSAWYFRSLVLPGTEI
jgi:hypothetical protein